MSQRSRLVFVLVAAVLLVILVLLLWPTAPTPEENPWIEVFRNPSTSGEYDFGENPFRPASPVAADGESSASIQEGPRLEIRAVVGEWPLPGVQVLPVERFEDGSLIASIGEGAPESGETGRGGSITLRYTTEPPERLFGFLPGDLELEAADNAEEIGKVLSFRVFRGKSAEPVTLRFREAEGLVAVRPVDAATGASLEDARGIRLVVRYPGGDDAGDVSYLRRGDDGWFRVDGIDGAEAIHLHVPGYLPAPAPVGGWRGRTIVRLSPDPAIVRGRLTGPVETVIAATIRSASDDGTPCASPLLHGLPGGSGPFTLSGLPEGTWVLEVCAIVGREERWAMVRFEFRGEGLDLGEIPWRPGATLRVRCRTKGGEPVDGWPVLVATGLAGEVPELAYSRYRGELQVGVLGPMRDESLEEHRGSSAADGWATFDGLRPGGTYFVATARIPGWWRSVTMPDSAGAEAPAPVTVEITEGGPLTTCVLRFTVNGSEPARWIGFHGPALSDDFSTGKGILEAEIPPGRHRFRLGAVLDDADESSPHGGSRVTAVGEVEIPDSGRFEATVDLVAPK